MDSEADKTILDETPVNRFSHKKLYALPYTHKRPWIAMIINLFLLSITSLSWIVPLLNTEKYIDPSLYACFALVPAYYMTSIWGFNLYTICKVDDFSINPNFRETCWKPFMGSFVVFKSSLQQIMVVIYIAGWEVFVYYLVFYVIQCVVRNFLDWALQKLCPLVFPPLFYFRLLESWSILKLFNAGNFGEGIFFFSFSSFRSKIL